MEIVINLLRGAAIGLANIIPGVSGGTMALILGIYERLLGAIGKLGPRTVKAVLKGPRGIWEEMKRVDAVFLGTLGVGAMVAIVVVARVMKDLLTHQHDPTYGFFFGLVLASVVVPYRMVRRKGPGMVISALLAVAMVVGLTLAMSGEEQVASERKKLAIKAAKVEAQVAAAAAALPSDAAAGEGGAAAAGAAAALERVPRDAPTMVLFFLAGVVAISAMILPGISGSFMLLLMGVYFDVLTCINNRQFVLLGILALGCVVGLLVFTRLLNWLLARYHDLTMSFLLGLVLGSLYAIWPFKTFEMVGPKRVDMDNFLPASFGQNELLTLGAAALGVAIVVIFLVIEAKQGKGEKTAA